MKETVNSRQHNKNIQINHSHPGLTNDAKAENGESMGYGRR